MSSRPDPKLPAPVVAALVLAGAAAGAWAAGDGTAASRPAKASPIIRPDKPNVVRWAPTEARYVRFLIRAGVRGQPCIDELEVYGPEGTGNLALAAAGAKATASSCLPGYAIHQIPHLNDGRYGNSHSWIAATARGEWAQIELPRAAKVAKLVFSRDRSGRYRDRLPVQLDVLVSLDGRRWRTVARIDAAPAASGAPPREPPPAFPLPTDRPPTYDDLLRYAFGEEPAVRAAAARGEGIVAALPLVLRQTAEMLERAAAAGLDVAAERAELAALRRRREALAQTAAGAAAERLYLDARRAKRRLFFRGEGLDAIERILFVKRHPFGASHNYSDILDGLGRPGGGVYVLEVPRRDGRWRPAEARLARRFDARGGVARDAVAGFGAGRVYFAYKETLRGYYHVMTMRADGTGVKRLTDGPFHDFYPCPLPDGGVALMSTRCRSRFLCWRPQAFVLFRMGADGGSLAPLSHANLSEWSPSVMRDGRILWTRSEYLDKGADYGHTLWAIRPDGTHPELIFGNNTRYAYFNGREVPGTGEICCVLGGHFRDHNGPVALIDPAVSRFDERAIRNLTPDAAPQSPVRSFRDPVPISRSHVLCSHAPADRFGLYVIDRFGNRELLYLDPAIGSVCPTPLRPVPRPPVVAAAEDAHDEQPGHFVLVDVYEGLTPRVPRGSVRYVRVCQEVPARLRRLPNGEYQKDHPSFEDWYATPVHRLRYGKRSSGWPSYVAKASLGLAPVEADGSASFYAPAGKVLYFQALDADLTEVQRMRSVVQLQPGERRSCIGCHEDRTMAPPARRPAALRRAPSTLKPPPWGATPLAYERVVQPVWNARCVRCHHARHKRGIDLTAALDADKVPASYRTLIEQGWVDYFNYNWHQPHRKADPLTRGNVNSRLWKVLGAGHHDVKLTPEEQHRVKCWVDLNCPLWPDYTFRRDRGAIAQQAATSASRRLTASRPSRQKTVYMNAPTP